MCAGLDVSGVVITSVNGVPVNGAAEAPASAVGAPAAAAAWPALPEWAYPFTPVTELPSAPVQACIQPPPGTLGFFAIVVIIITRLISIFSCQKTRCVLQATCI